MVMLGVKVVYMVVIGAGMERVVIVMTVVLVVRESAAAATQAGKEKGWS